MYKIWLKRRGHFEDPEVPSAVELCNCKQVGFVSGLKKKSPFYRFGECFVILIPRQFNEMKYKGRNFYLWNILRRSDYTASGVETTAE